MPRNFSILFLTLMCSIKAFAQSPTTTLIPGRGYELVLSGKHPGVVAGTKLEVTAYAEYFDEQGNRIGHTTSEPLILTVGKSIIKKEWSTGFSDQYVAIIWAGSGDGGLELEGRKLTAWVSIPNDGQVHTFTWRMYLKKLVGLDFIW